MCFLYIQYFLIKGHPNIVQVVLNGLNIGHIMWVFEISFFFDCVKRTRFKFCLFPFSRVKSFSLTITTLMEFLGKKKGKLKLISFIVVINLIFATVKNKYLQSTEQRKVWRDQFLENLTLFTQVSWIIWICHNRTISDILSWAFHTFREENVKVWTF